MWLIALDTIDLPVSANYYIYIVKTSFKLLIKHIDTEKNDCTDPESLAEQRSI
jgi:hypothetical protein